MSGCRGKAAAERPAGSCGRGRLLTVLAAGVVSLRGDWQVLDAMDTLSSYDIRRFVEMWFMGAPMEQVYEDNMRSFLAWSMFATHLPQLTRAQREDVDDIVEQLHTRYGVKFHPVRRRTTAPQHLSNASIATGRCVLLTFVSLLACV